MIESTARRTHQTLEIDLLPWADPYITQLFQKAMLLGHPSMVEFAADSPARQADRRAQTEVTVSRDRAPRWRSTGLFSDWLLAREELNLYACWLAAERGQLDFQADAKCFDQRRANSGRRPLDLFGAELWNPFQRGAKGKMDVTLPFTWCERAPHQPGYDFAASLILGSRDPLRRAWGRSSLTSPSTAAALSENDGGDEAAQSPASPPGELFASLAPSMPGWGLRRPPRNRPAANHAASAVSRIHQNKTSAPHGEPGSDKATPEAKKPAVASARRT